MNNVFVYCELTDKQKIADVSLELLTKGRKLADTLNCKLEALVIGNELKAIEKGIFPYGVDTLYLAKDERLSPYTTQPHTAITTKLFQEQKPVIALMGATNIGRDLGPRVSSALSSGLTADCTELIIGNHEDRRTKKVYKNILYQIRPAFGGNIVATIINPEHTPQMATVREGVMRKEIVDKNYKGKLIHLDVNKYLSEKDFNIRILDRKIEASKINIKNAPIIVSGGYGVGSKENFSLLFELASLIGAEIGASRAAVDAGFVKHSRQIGQTGITVRPKLYIACGISGQIQHITGMQEASMIISINNDPNAPINDIADVAITGDIQDVLTKMIKYYKENSK